jgi:hypothetical protein
MNDGDMNNSGTEMESSVSIAVLAPDSGTIVGRLKDMVNLAAAAISVANPAAGLAVQTTAVLGGWIFQDRKCDRIRDALESVAARIQRVESEYVRKEEFADLLEDTLRRMADQPDEGRRHVMREVLESVMQRPRDFTESRLFVRLADELPTTHLKVIAATRAAKTRMEVLLPSNSVLANRSGIPDGRIDGVMTDLTFFRVFDGMRFNMSVPEGQTLEHLLTDIGREFVGFMAE